MDDHAHNDCQPAQLPADQLPVDQLPIIGTEPAGRRLAMRPEPGSGSPLRVTLTALAGVPLVRPGDDLAALILAALDANGEVLQDGDVVVIAQKIVSKAEDRYRSLASVVPSAAALDLAAATGKDPRLVHLILAESEAVLRHRFGVVVAAHRRGWVLANAGIDRSNLDPGGADGERVLLLPADPDRTCTEVRAVLRERTGATVAVLINDSLGRAWRLGTVGTALGAAGLPALHDLRGRPDLAGRRLEVSQVALADELAAAASAVMGQAAEGRPLVLIRGYPLPAGDGCAGDLVRPAAEDLFR